MSRRSQESGVSPGLVLQNELDAPPALFEEWLREQVPEVKSVTAHGQMSATQV